MQTIHIPSGTVAAKIFAVVAVSGLRGGTDTVPIHEIPILRMRARAMAGEQVTAYIEMLPEVDRVQFLSQADAIAEYQRLATKHDHVQIEEDQERNFASEIYPTVRDFARASAEMLRAWSNLQQRISEGYEATDVDVERIADIGDPRRAADLLETITLDQIATTEDGQPQPAEQQTPAPTRIDELDDEQAAAFAAFLKDGYPSIKHGTLDAVVQLAVDGGLPLAAMDLGGIKGVGEQSAAVLARLSEDFCQEQVATT